LFQSQPTEELYGDKDFYEETEDDTSACLMADLSCTEEEEMEDMLLWYSLAAETATSPLSAKTTDHSSNSNLVGEDITSMDDSAAKFKTTPKGLEEREDLLHFPKHSLHTDNNVLFRILFYVSPTRLKTLNWAAVDYKPQCKEPVPSRSTTYETTTAEVCLATHLVHRTEEREEFYFPCHLNPFANDPISFKNFIHPTSITLSNPSITHEISTPFVVKQLLGLQDIYKDFLFYSHFNSLQADDVLYRILFYAAPNKLKAIEPAPLQDIIARDTPQKRFDTVHYKVQPSSTSTCTHGHMDDDVKIIKTTQPRRLLPEPPPDVFLFLFLFSLIHLLVDYTFLKAAMHDLVHCKVRPLPAYASTHANI